MVNTPTPFLSSQPLQQTLVQQLEQLVQHQLTSHTFVQWAEAQHWQLLEGVYKTDQTPAAQNLRELMADILLQWECLQAHHHETHQNGAEPILEFPMPWLTTWLNQIQPTSKTAMSTLNFNGPVGIANVNSTINGNQTGIQHNAMDPELSRIIANLKTWITDLQQRYPTATEAEVETIIDTEFSEMTQLNATESGKLNRLRQQLFNPERHFQATKAALGETAKHYLEDSVWAKAILTYIDKLSETPDHGA